MLTQIITGGHLEFVKGFIHHFWLWQSSDDSKFISGVSFWVHAEIKVLRLQPLRRNQYLSTVPNHEPFSETQQYHFVEESHDSQKFVLELSLEYSRSDDSKTLPGRCRYPVHLQATLRLSGDVLSVVRPECIGFVKFFHSKSFPV